MQYHLCYYYAYIRKDAKNTLRVLKMMKEMKELDLYANEIDNHINDFRSNTFVNRLSLLYFLRKLTLSSTTICDAKLSFGRDFIKSDKNRLSYGIVKYSFCSDTDVLLLETNLPCELEEGIQNNLERQVSLIYFREDENTLTVFSLNDITKGTKSNVLLREKKISIKEIDDKLISNDKNLVVVKCNRGDDLESIITNCNSIADERFYTYITRFIIIILFYILGSGKKN